MINRAKGTRDLNPVEALTKEKIIDTIRSVFKIYGFYPIESPTLERYDAITAKYAGGSEILKETFKLIDQGGRELALRYDLTVPLAIYTASNPSVKLPLKAYRIEQVFRDGPVKTGRYREFTQADVDIVGSSSILADAECVKLALDVFERLKIKAEIRVNNRTLIDSILGYLGIDNKKDVIIAIDKLEKIGIEEVKKELKGRGLNDDKINKLFSIITAEGNNKEILSKAKKMLGENNGVKEIEMLLGYVKDKRVKITLSLARGLEYYTGNVFEAFSPAINSSMAAGGRYDNMIGVFVGGKQQYPAVGISFGVDILLDIINKEGKKTDTKVFIIPINTEKKCLEIVKKLRSSGINTDIDIMNRGVSKNLDYANRLGIKYVVFAGKKELSKNKVKLRDMQTGKERLLSVKKLVDELKD